MGKIPSCRIGVISGGRSSGGGNSGLTVLAAFGLDGLSLDFKMSLSFSGC